MKIPDTITSIKTIPYDEKMLFKVYKSGRASMKMVNRMIAIRKLFNW